MKNSSRFERSVRDLATTHVVDFIEKFKDQADAISILDKVKEVELPKSREFLQAAKKGNDFVTEAILQENKYYIFEYNNVSILNLNSIKSISINSKFTKLFALFNSLT